MNNKTPPEARGFIMTYDTFDALCDRLSQLPHIDGDTWHPTVEDVTDKIAPTITVDRNMLQFALYLDETLRAPQTDDEKQARKLLRKLINENLTLVDPT